jgi:hypothetical protein
VTWDERLLHSVSKHAFGITPAPTFDVQSHTLLAAAKLGRGDAPTTPQLRPCALHGLLNFCALHQNDHPRWTTLHLKASDYLDATWGGGTGAPKATMCDARSMLAALHCVNLTAMVAVLDLAVSEAAAAPLKVAGDKAGVMGVSALKEEAAFPPEGCVLYEHEEEIGFDAQGIVKSLGPPLPWKACARDDGPGPIQETLGAESASTELLELLGILQARPHACLHCLGCCVHRIALLAPVGGEAAGRLFDR